jgi:transmembrane sensor
MTDASAKTEPETIAATAAQWVARRDAGLSAAAQHELDRWLAADPRHAAALRHYLQAWSVFDRPAGDGSAAAVVQAVQARRRRRHRRIIATATALGCLVLGGMVGRAWLFPPIDRTAGPVPTAIVHQPETRTLADGSVVELRPGAVIAVDFSGALRRVALQKGEAHFQVAKDAARPFVVSAGGVETRAVGTAFAVELGRGAVEVLVTEGRVAVSHSPEEKISTAAPRVLVDAGRRVLLTTTAGKSELPSPAEVTATELAERLAWRTARLEFTGTPLAEAVALMNRSGRNPAGRPKIQLVIDAASPGLAAEPVSGLFRADSAETFVRMLELSLGITTERRSENEIVLRKVK